jgi:hypothetical protein
MTLDYGATASLPENNYFLEKQTLVCHMTSKKSTFIVTYKKSKCHQKKRLVICFGVHEPTMWL